MSQTALLEKKNFFGVKSKTERKITYFCRLCREYGIKTRKSHLQNFHNASRDTVNKRSNDDLVDTIFIKSSH